MMSSPLTPDERRDRLVFYPVAIVGGLFCLTVLMTIAAAFGDAQSPATKWLNQNATPLLLWETAVLAAVSLMAMAIDRTRTLRRLKQAKSASSATPHLPPADGHRRSDGADAGESHVD